MKIQTPSSKRFASALATVAKCIQSKNSIAILDNILLSQNSDKQFFITAGSAEAMLTLPVDLSIVDGKWTKSICLPRKVIDFLQTLPDTIVTFEVAERDNLTIHYCTMSDKDNAKNGKASLVYLEADCYPQTPELSDVITHICLPGSVLAEKTNIARQFTASDELRPVMNHVALDVTYDSCVFVASNGQKLFKYVHSNDPKNGGSDFYRKGNGIMLLNKDAVGVLSVFEDCEEVNIETDGKHIHLSADGIVYSIAIFEGRYPNYDSVIPKLDSYVTVRKKEMLSVLKRVSLFGSISSQLVVFNYDGSMFLTLKAEDNDFSLAAEDQVLIVNQSMPGNLRIGFKSSVLMDCLNACDDDEVTIYLREPSTAALIRPSDVNTPLLCLLMPMLIND